MEEGRFTGRVSSLLRRLSRANAVVVMAVGLAVLAAWLLDYDPLKGLASGLPTMKVNTALCFFLSGGVLLMAGLERPSPALRRFSASCAGLVMAVAALTLAEYLFGVNLGLDNLFVTDRAYGVELGYPGRMSPSTALCFVALAAALLCVEMKTRLMGWPSQYLAALVGLSALMGVGSYAYGQREFSGIARYTQMAVHTTGCFLLLALGVFLVQAERGFMQVVSSPGLGGVLARRLLPPALALPLVLGGLGLGAYRAGALPLPFALALIAVGNIFFFTILVWGVAFSLDRAESERRRGEEERMGLAAREQAAREEAAAQQRERSRAEAERRRFEVLSQRLAEREQLLRLMVESAGLSTWTMDCRTRLITADARFLALYGLQAPEPVPLPAVLDRLHPEDRPGVERAFEAALAGENGGRFLAENRLQGPPGAYHWGETRAQVTFAPDGAPLTMQGVSFDVTERKEAEALREELLQRTRAENERQRLMFEQAPASIALLEGPEHHFRVANARYIQLVGGRQVLGRSVAEALPEVVEQGFITLLDTVRRTGEPYVGRETWLQLQRRPEGPLEDVCVDFVYQPIRDASGQVDTIFVHAVEVTDLVRSREVARQTAQEMEVLADTLRANEERLDLAMNVVGAGIWELDMSTQQVLADRRFRALFGLTPDEPFALEKGLAIVHPEDRPRVAVAIAEAIAGKQGGAYEADYRTVPRADGSYRWVAARGQVFLTPEGQARRFIGTGVDISERKSAELAQTRLLHSIADQDVFGVAVLEGPELRFTLANAGFRVLVGGRDVVGRPLLEALPELVGQGVETLLHEVLRTGKSVTASEARFRVDVHGTGSPEARFYTFTMQALRSPDAEPTGVLVLAHDITEGVRDRTSLEVTAEKLYRSESRLALALAVSGTGTWEMDLKTGLFTLDARFREMFGLPHAEPITLEAGLAFVHPEDRARVADGVAEALAGKNGGAYAAEYRTVRQEDGSYRWVSARGQVHVNPDDQGMHLVGTGLEITGSVRARERSEALAQQERARAEFAQQLIGIVSHDLRNPLGAIRLGAATLQRREALDPKSARTLVRIQSATDRAERMVRDLLDFTQVRLADGLKIERQPADLHELVRGVVQEVEEAQPGVHIRQEARGEGRGAWDADRLQQVVQNLVTNALKYGTPGECVDILTEGHEDTVTLSVHNRGEPIPPERQAAIFQPMQRGVEGVDRQGRSVGLGLFIVRAIVEAHGGTIALTSQAGEGTTFRIVLPREALAPPVGTRDA